MSKIVAVIVSAIIFLSVLPRIFFSLLHGIDAMLYVSFGILTNLMKLIFMMAMFVMLIAFIVVLIKGIGRK